MPQAAGKNLDSKKLTCNRIELVTRLVHHQKTSRHPPAGPPRGWQAGASGTEERRQGSGGDGGHAQRVAGGHRPGSGGGGSRGP